MSKINFSKKTLIDESEKLKDKDKSKNQIENNSTVKAIKLNFQLQSKHPDLPDVENPVNNDVEDYNIKI